MGIYANSLIKNIRTLQVIFYRVNYLFLKSNKILRWDISNDLTEKCKRFIPDETKCKENWPYRLEEFNTRLWGL